MCKKAGGNAGLFLLQRVVTRLSIARVARMRGRCPVHSVSVWTRLRCEGVRAGRQAGLNVMATPFMQ